MEPRHLSRGYVPKSPDRHGGKPGLRIVTWNCRIGGFRYKSEHMEKLKPDVLAVQEVEPLDGVLLFAGETQPTFRDRVADPAYPRRAIGVFSYTDTQLEPVDVADPLYCFRRYEASRGDLAFNVVGVWTAATDVSEISYMQAIGGLRAHQAGYGSAQRSSWEISMTMPPTGRQTCQSFSR